MELLYDKLTKYAESNFYAFHMPGHKRNCSILDGDFSFSIDITEIEGFDDLHHAKDILKDAQKRAALIYGAEETRFLINGSTCGILSAILGCTRKQDTILVARNCHKSVYNAMYLNELNPIYVYPKFEEGIELNGEIMVEDIREKLLKYKEIKAVVIVSPTYDGVVSDVKAIASVAHAHNIPLIVDEAHGAHFGYDKYFPENANRLGADIVIHSMHKTLPTLTQTALIHLNGNLINRKRVNQYLSMVQTSSPSYVLMASIDECIGMLSDKKICKSIFTNYIEKLEYLRNKLQELKCLSLIRTEHFDPSKIVISVKNTFQTVKNNNLVRTIPYTSQELYQELLESYYLQMEMVAGSYILAMTSIGDTWEGIKRFEKALFEIDARLLRSQRDRPSETCETEFWSQKSQGDRPSDSLIAMERIYEGKTQSKDWIDCIGSFSAEFAYVYPPGIPILVPGERISAESIKILQQYNKQGFRIEGLQNNKKIEVYDG